MSAPRAAELEALVESRIADLTRCRHHLASGICPALLGLTGEVTAPPESRIPGPVNGTRLEERRPRPVSQPPVKAEPSSRAAVGSTPAPAKPPAALARPIVPPSPGARPFGDDEILHVVTALKGATTREIAEALDAKYSAVWYHVKALEERGQLKKGERGKYQRTVAQG